MIRASSERDRKDRRRDAGDEHGGLPYGANLDKALIQDSADGEVPDELALQHPGVPPVPHPDEAGPADGEDRQRPGPYLVGHPVEEACYGLRHLYGSHPGPYAGRGGTYAAGVYMADPVSICRGLDRSLPLPITGRGVDTIPPVDRRKEYMMLLIILSRVDVDACAPFLEGIPEAALHAPDDPWWATADREDLLEAMARTIDVLRV